jgi:hypothetical protein
MKILIILLVLNFWFIAHIFCVNVVANENITTTSIRPTFSRSKYARRGHNTNDTQVTNKSSIPAGNSTSGTGTKVKSITPTLAPNVNVTLAITASPNLNKTVSLVVSNTTLVSAANINLSYEGCGIRNNENHPWLAIIEHTPPKYLDNSKLRVRKTLSKGVLIHPNYVLTTISSIHNSHPFWIVSAVRLGDKMTLDIGDYNSTNLINPVKVSVHEVFLHRHKDIAIIKLAHKINITDYIRPICLPTDRAYNYRELFLHFCKYRSFRRNTREQRVTTEPVSPISPQDCRILFTRKHTEIAIDNEFCAWDEVGDTCAGDIGSPLFVEINSKNTIIGLKSIATSDNEDLQLDSTIPGVYTRVGSYLKWISAIINSNE